MKEIFIKTFGGLSVSYYVRQMFFGVAIATLMVIFTIKGHNSVEFWMPVFLFVNTALYPYSRFVYESVVDFIIGSNEFFVNTAQFLLTKLITMSICWFFAILIAPLGLVYLYHHNKNAN